MDPAVDSSPSEPAQPRGPISGLFRSLAQLLATAIGIAQTRLELLSTELQEEVHRVAEIMVWATIALLAAGVGLFLLALVIIFVFWDTHRIAGVDCRHGRVFLDRCRRGARAAAEGAQPSRRCSMRRWPSSRRTARAF